MIYEFDFNPEKNKWLKANRNISFEEVIYLIESGNLLDIVKHPNQEQYKDQETFIVNIDNYAYLIPYLKREPERIILLTIFPSRKATRNYILKENE